MAVFCLGGIESIAQRTIEISYAADMQGNYQFTCNNRAFCTYIVEIEFSRIEHAHADHPLPFRAEVKPGNNKLFKLIRDNGNDPVQFKYGTSNHKGCINPVVDPDFTYLLPIRPRKEAQVYEMTSPEKSSPGEPDSRNWYVIRLKMKPGDTIFCARRGIVSEVDVSSNLNDSGVTSAGHENYIEIVHADCSFGHYGILKKDGAFVKPGELVEAGKPIGLVGGDRFGRGAEIRFSVYYNKEEESATGTAAVHKMYWVYVPLKFWTRRNGKGKLVHGANYTSEFPDSVLNQELKKPENKTKKPKPKAK
ncbi:MAG: M23 family metallopeptidase [Chitinophagales bacterium]